MHIGLDIVSIVVGVGATTIGVMLAVVLIVRSSRVPRPPADGDETPLPELDALDGQDTH